VACAPSAPEGRFATGLGDGEYRIVPEDPTLSWIGGPGTSTHSFPGLVVAGTSDVALVVVTQAESLGHLLEVEAVDGLTGQAIAVELGMFARVQLEGALRPYFALAVVPGMPGLFRSTNTLPAGVHDVTIAATGRRPVIVVRIPGAWGRRIHVEPVARHAHHGHVHEESGTVPPGVVVRVEKSEPASGPTAPSCST
jgi:hypothetical protein